MWFTRSKGPNTILYASDRWPLFNHWSNGKCIYLLSDLVVALRELLVQHSQSLDGRLQTADVVGHHIGLGPFDDILLLHQRRNPHCSLKHQWFQAWDNAVPDVVVKIGNLVGGRALVIINNFSKFLLLQDWLACSKSFACCMKSSAILEFWWISGAILKPMDESSFTSRAKWTNLES